MRFGSASSLQAAWGMTEYSKPPLVLKQAKITGSKRAEARVHAAA